MIKLTNYIRCIRLQKGLSQENMAYDLNISITAYSKIERGLTNISFTRLVQIAKCLGVSITSLIEYYENAEKENETSSGNNTTGTYVEGDCNEETILNMQTQIMDLEEAMKILEEAIEQLNPLNKNKKVEE
ncbi:MAG: helix-turn-helix transcriptional regulator [Candidatus Azobacteroides sp.]|nr:helix-turn-helix transcriptional regulator [Candidatus Azobacteroides sp.]